MPRKIGPFPVFINSGEVQRITPPEPAPTRPASGGVAGKVNPNQNTYFGGPPRGTLDSDTHQQAVEIWTNSEEQS